MVLMANGIARGRVRRTTPSHITHLQRSPLKGRDYTNRTVKIFEKYHYQLDWKEIYRIPFRVTVDYRSREFQFKVLHRHLTTNKFLHKIASYLRLYAHSVKEKANLLNTF